MIPKFTFNDVLNELGAEWHSKEYGIASLDKILDKDLTLEYQQDFYEIMLVLDGDLELKVNEIVLEMKPKSVTLLAPHTVLKLTSFTEKFDVISICFTEVYLANSLMNIGIVDFLKLFYENLGKSATVTDNDIAALKNLFLLLSEASNEESKGENRKHYISTLIVSYLLKVSNILEYSFNEKTASPSINEIAARFQVLILKEPNRKIDFYADKLHISVQHLIRIIKKVTGETPHSLISRSTITTAKILLKKKDLSISSISDELLFADTSSFGKFFKKHTGLSPLSYRNKP